MLRGTLRTNHEVVLVGARVTHLLPGHSRISGRLGLHGLEVPEGDLPFDAVEFQVTGLSRLSGVSPLTRVQVPAVGRSSEAAYVLTLSGEVDQTWSMPCDDTITLGYDQEAGPLFGGHRFGVSFNPVLRVEGAARTAEDWLDTYVRPAAQLSTFALAGKQSIWVELTNVDDPHRTVQVFASDIAQEPYEADAQHGGRLEPLLRLGPGGASLADLLSGWRRMSAQYDIFFDYLTSSLSASMTVRARFVALLPALESYHTVKYGTCPVTRDVFRAARKELLDRIKALKGVEPQDLKRLRDDLPMDSSYALHERLRQLADDLPPELKARIDARVDPIPDSLGGIHPDPKDVWAIEGKAHNNLAHGSARPTAEQLQSLTFLAHTLAIGLALAELGAPDTTLATMIDQGEWRIL
ncbi:hypothetical protein [Streptomyces sp. NRRL B-24085]|uniref:hypothetical protein n=1 Tax=Streptomyces sp. NRRL B-24085 TaxID=1709476 RepID=UPI0006B2FD24|nr:hypothetical protein [Streptomyces sp. NRRL B-24085]